MLHTGIRNIPMKSCTYPWSLRLPPVQFTRVMVASLVTAPATRCSLPERLSYLLRLPPGIWPG